MDSHISQAWTVIPLLLLLGPAARLVETLKPTNKVVPSCPPEVTTCEFHFVIRYNITMMKWVMADDTNSPDVMLPVVVGNDGQFYAKRKDCSGEDPLTKQDFETFLSGDGSYKRLLVINEQYPGEPIVVYKGQMVSVIVTNELENEVITMHWHGMSMRGTPWMDGAGTVSQCPITPRQSFQYRFLADKVGTRWYHGHVGSERTMGMAGHLTVLDRSAEEENSHRGDDPNPPIDGEFHMMLSEWMSSPTNEHILPIRGAGIQFADGFDSDVWDFPTKLVDGSDANWIPFESILINGKGHRFKRNSSQAEKPTLPLEVFSVKKGGVFRFRSVNAGTHMTFSVSIDEHLLHVITTDGEDIRTTPVDHLVIHAGERFDFWVNASDPTSAGNYWIRVETLEHMTNDLKTLEVPGHVEGILRYDHATEVRPKTETRNCLLDACLYLNCPFKLMPLVTNRRCISIVDLRQPVPLPTLTPENGTGFTELQLSFEVLATSTINGINHVAHSTPPQIYPKTSSDVICSNETCPTSFCSCTHEVSIKKDNIVQLVLFSYKSSFPPISTNHPVHLHGHSFQVVKLGWPVYNATTGVAMANSPDIDCGETPSSCHRPKWADPSWNNGNVPGIVTEGAVVKDTLMVPSGGYVVLRFKADNPGYWLLHCHMDTHSEMGMMMVLKEGEVSDMAPLPKGFPVCGDFDWSSGEFERKISSPKPQGDQETLVEDKLAETCFPLGDDQQLLGIATFQVTTAVLGVLCSIGTLAMVVNTYRHWKKRNEMKNRGLLSRSNRAPLEESTPLLE